MISGIHQTSAQAQDVLEYVTNAPIDGAGKAADLVAASGIDTVKDGSKRNGTVPEFHPEMLETVHRFMTDPPVDALNCMKKPGQKLS